MCDDELERLSLSLSNNNNGNSVSNSWLTSPAVPDAIGELNRRMAAAVSIGDNLLQGEPRDRMETLQDCSTFHCFEFLSLRHLDWQEQKDVSVDQDEEVSQERLHKLQKEKEWYMALFTQRTRNRLKTFLKILDESSSTSSFDSSPLPASLLCPGPSDRHLSLYLSTFDFTELHLDNVFHTGLLAVARGGEDPNSEVPTCLFRCCPNVKVLSLRNNYLDTIPPDVGRLKYLQKLFLTNNRLQNRSVPSTLIFCSELSELYLDHNLLDALPGFLLRMPNLRVVHRHGNHNYFKATFMWYHTDVNNRIMVDPGRQEQGYQRQSVRDRTSIQRESTDGPFHKGSLQEASALAALGGRLDFFEAGSILPPKMQGNLSSLVKVVNLCGNCAVAKHISQPGFKVFTFKNPYLGNTCVPFLHWACSKDCAEAIEVPARREQVLSAREQDRLYQRRIRQTVATLRPSQRSISSLAASDEEDDEDDVDQVANTNHQSDIDDVSSPVASPATLPRMNKSSSSKKKLIRRSRRPSSPLVPSPSSGAGGNSANASSSSSPQSYCVLV